MNFRLVSWLLLGALLNGCSTEHYRKSADKEVGSAITQKSAKVPNMDPKFTIQTNGVTVLTGLPINQTVQEFLGTDGEIEREAPMLSLHKALEVAVKQSRIYQTQKEQLYLAGLQLTLDRHQFTPIFSGSGNGTYTVQNGQQVTTIPDPSDPTKTITTDTMVEQHQVNGSSQIGVDWMIRDLGKISAAFTTDFFRFVTGSPQAVASSQVGATFTRPLLRDAGFKAEMENLTQSERNLLYAMRDFTKFRKQFSVDIATAYYGVLGNRDTVRNSYLNFQSSKRTAERSRALAREGRVTQSDLGRLEQQVLTAETTWIGAVRTYKNALDDFKIQLGIPVKTRLILDDHELEQLKIEHPIIGVDESIRVALAARLDFQNVTNQKEDAQRKIKVAADQFKPKLDMTANANLSSGSKSYGMPMPDPKNYQWSTGLSLDLPLDRKIERNNYRSALIQFESSSRALTLLRDQIELQVRESHRSLDQAKRNFEISQKGVDLAQRRVEEQDLLAELGRAKAQDQVDAQNDLVNSRNQLTQALVNHTIERLKFWNNMGILYIKENGQWYAKENAPKEDGQGGNKK